MNPQIDTTTRWGTAVGTILTLFDNIGSDDLFRTAVLAALGAGVSFAVTLILKFLFKRKWK